jgi:hypothetical protein
MSWDRPFAQPVPLPEGPPAQTLRDAADYIRKLPQPNVIVRNGGLPCRC